MENVPELDWANLQLDWEIPTRSLTRRQLRSMTTIERFAVACELTDEGLRRWRKALRCRFPDATPEQMREIRISIRLAESAQERAIAARRMSI